MSILKTGELYFDAYSNAVDQNHYVSSYYVLTGEPFYLEYKNKLNLNNNPSYIIDHYLTDFGDGSPIVYSYAYDLISAKYTKQGTYYISYTAVYLINGVEHDVPFYFNQPINVQDYWYVYTQNTIRLNDEIILNLPYSNEEIRIQPNEWGVADIFNTSITRIQDCLYYLMEKTQTISTQSPTLFFGWLGNYSATPSSYLKWITQSYNAEYLTRPDLATSGSGISYFTNAIDAMEVDDNLIVIDQNNLKFFKNKADPVEINFTNGDQLSSFLTNPRSFDIDNDASYLYISDTLSNTIYKLDISDTKNNNLTGYNINIDLFVGGYGALLDNNLFNNPIEIKYQNDNLYVVDYNNFCVKQYNKDLNWLFTYYIDDFLTNRPISVDALSNGLIYVLTENYKVYIFDNNSNIIFESFNVYIASDGSELLKIKFTANQDFLYILTEQNVFKFSLAGNYISTFNIPKATTIKYNNIKVANDNKIIISSNNCIFKAQDVLEIFKIGTGIPFSFWSYDQVTVSKNEFPSDLNYNRSLKRLNQNIKTLRDTLNAKYVIANETTPNGIVSYFSYIPLDYVSAKSSDPNYGLVFSDDIENEKVAVGVNELHVPAVINRELDKLYFALEQLADFLSIKNYTAQNTDCLDAFCWSWKATSCYKLTLPVIKTCSSNPITYTEINLAKNGYIQQYTPSITWGEAISQCCKK